MVEADSGDGIFVINTISDGFDEGGFTSILKSDDCDLEFFIEESALDPVDNFIEESQHHLNHLYYKTHHLLRIYHCSIYHHLVKKISGVKLVVIASRDFGLF